jgi:predicted TIM-barrel fold metal-dependent hydrolase
VDGLPLFDACAGLGPTSRRASPLAPETPGELVRALDDHGIEEALVYSNVARDHTPPVGNARLLAEVDEANRAAGRPRLHPQWVLLPHHTGEMPPPPALLEAMLRRGVRAARLYPAPAAHDFSVEAWCAGPLLRELQEHRVPLFLDQGQVPWNDLHRLLGDYPELPVALTRCGYRADRTLYPLWEAHRNLYVETSAYVVHAGLELVARRFGPERLLFGTGLPDLAPGAAVLFLVRSDLPDAWRRRIGAENLRRLLEGVRP